MKIYGNVISGIKFLLTLKFFSKAINPIRKARAQGHLEEERHLIALNEKNWVNKTVSTFDLKLHIKGQDNVPEGPCVIIPNHQGYADVIAVMKAFEGKQIGFVAKDNLVNMPYLGKWILDIRGLFLKRGDAREAIKVFNEGVELLKQGFSLVIFPEGTRSKGPYIGEFKSGSFKLAYKAEVPIVPVTVHNTYKAFEEKEVITKGVDLYATVHKPIITKGLTKSEQRELYHEVRNLIKNELDNLISETDSK